MGLSRSVGRGASLGRRDGRGFSVGRRQRGVDADDGFSAVVGSSGLLLDAVDGVCCSGDVSAQVRDDRRHHLLVACFSLDGCGD